MKYIVYSKPACTHCEQAKSLLEAKGLPFDVITLDVGQPKVDGAQYISRDELLAKIPTARTMPQIFEQNGVFMTHVGGFAELRQRLS